MVRLAEPCNRRQLVQTVITSIRSFLQCFWTVFNWCPHALDKEGCFQLASDSAGEEEGRIEGSEYDDGSVDGSEGSED